MYPGLTARSTFGDRVGLNKLTMPKGPCLVVANVATLRTLGYGDVTGPHNHSLQYLIKYAMKQAFETWQLPQRLRPISKMGSVKRY
jgi:hypothetical protein